jgi:hypothetical protein
MMTLLIEGGVPSWFTLLFGALSLAASVAFAVRQAPGQLRVARALHGATLYSTLTGILASLAAVGHHVNARWDELQSVGLVRVLCQGVAESMSAGIIGFVLLSLSLFVVGVGQLRRPSEAQ